MNRLRLEAWGSTRRVIRRGVALLTIGAAGRVLWYAAVDAFILYVFGNPAPSPGRNRRDPAGPAQRPGTGAGAEAAEPAPWARTDEGRPASHRAA